MARPRPNAGSRTGMTFLEVVLAVILLGLVAATLAMGMGGLTRSQTRQEQQLACCEVANALLLTYMDDEKAVPSELKPIAYGEQEYRFSLDVDKAVITLDRAALTDAKYSRKAATIDRIKQVTVRVWPSEDYGGSFRYDPHLPSATLSRLIDPVSFANPDTISTKLQTEGGLIDLLNNLSDLDGGTTQGTSSQGDK